MVNENEISVEIVNETYRLCQECFERGQNLLYILSEIEEETEMSDNEWSDACESEYVENYNHGTTARHYLTENLDRFIALANGTEGPRYQFDDMWEGDSSTANIFLTVHNAVISYMFHILDYMHFTGVGNAHKLKFRGPDGEIKTLNLTVQNERSHSILDAKRALPRWRDPSSIEQKLLNERVRTLSVLTKIPLPVYPSGKLESLTARPEIGESLDNAIFDLCHDVDNTFSQVLKIIKRDFPYGTERLTSDAIRKRYQRLCVDRNVAKVSRRAGRRSNKT